MFLRKNFHESDVWQTNTSISLLFFSLPDRHVKYHIAVQFKYNGLYNIYLYIYATETVHDMCHPNTRMPTRINLYSTRLTIKGRAARHFTNIQYRVPLYIY